MGLSRVRLLGLCSNFYSSQFSMQLISKFPRQQYFFSPSTGIMKCNFLYSRSQWPRGLRCRSAAARLLRLWVRNPPGAWMSVCCDYCVLSSRGVCDELITRPEESYRLLCVVVCDLDTSWMRRPWPTGGWGGWVGLLCQIKKNSLHLHYFF